jgi:hypothetical protein
MKMYKFVLLDMEYLDAPDGAVVMSTEVDEPNPQIDAEFWDRFLQGDCEMKFMGSYEEEVLE